MPATLVVKESKYDAKARKSIERELREHVKLRVTIRGGNLYMGAIVGLGAYGYHKLRSIELDSTGNEAVDGILKRSADAAVTTMPPWAVDEQQGLTAGDPTCLPTGVMEQLGGSPR